MLYFPKQTYIMHELHIHSFLTQFPFICYNNTNFWPVPISHANGLIALPPLTLTSFKAMYITLKCARFLKIGNVALYQERTILIVSKFQYTQCKGRRQWNWNQYLGVSHLSGIQFSFPIILLSEISQSDYVHLNTCKNVQIMHPNANIDETRYFVWSISV